MPYNLDMRKFIPILTVVWAIIIFRLTTTPQLTVSDNSFLQTMLMMAGHFVFFGIQAMLLSFNTAHNSAIMITSVYGGAIELIQRRVPGRSADPIDWLLDTLGAFVFIIFLRRYKKV